MAFPSIHFLDSDGQDIIKHTSKQGDRSVAAFEKTGAIVKTFIKYKGKKDLGERAAVRYFIARLQLGQFKFEQAQQKLAKLGKLGANNVTIVNAELALLEFNEVMSDMRKNSRVRVRGQRPDSMQIRTATGKRFAAMFRADRIPKGQSSFWGYLILYAEAEKDAKLATDALAGLKEQFGNDRHYSRLIESLANKVENIKDN